MSTHLLKTLILLSTIMAGSAYADSTVDNLLTAFSQQGAGPFTAAAGGELWQQDHNGRSCSLCHGQDVSKPGKHANTGKLIDPMAPSVNPDRLTDQAKVEKWLFRNCRWTLGRECTAQEKGDVLTWLSQQ
ncbi:DUF1924 domain-containing protein [Gynuella sp.]|uniref:DUF1924 domain-containing protein n=1 Tax=Gynuella sp. TaxID=2969146 RepID=UPI003D099ED3